MAKKNNLKKAKQQHEKNIERERERRRAADSEKAKKDVEGVKVHKAKNRRRKGVQKVVKKVLSRKDVVAMAVDEEGDDK